jgi:ABC-type transport system substrate-binding protein
MGEVLQASFAKIGVRLNVTQTEWNPMFSRLQRFARDKNPADAVDIFTMVRGPFVPHQYAYFNSYEKGQPNNFMAYENRTVQELFDRGYVLAKEADAMRLYTQGVTRIVADQPDLWPYTEKRVVVLRREIEGYYMHPTWFPETHVWTIYRK